MRFAFPTIIAVIFAAPLGARGEVDLAHRLALEAFVDGVVATYLSGNYLAGVTLSIVENGEVVLLKGYGIAGVDPERPVDPERSLFRIGSISKTFLWTALMQLAERGTIGLDDPINDHLPEDLRIPDDGFDEPIRVRHLMTHTAGLEYSILGHGIAREAQDLLTLREYLRLYHPRRVREPGDLIAYSNYGAALAGYIVAHVSGVDFETYVDENILRPLEMNHSSFREPHGDVAPAALPSPMPKELAGDVAQGLEWSEGAWQAQDYEYLSQIGPAGSMSSTAADMARFMLAHLGHGNRILSPETAERMHQVSFSHAEGMRGLAHGFVQWDLPGGLDNLGHNGGTLHFMSNMVIVPGHDLGIFVATNTSASGNGILFVNTLPSFVIEQFFVEDADTPRTLEKAGENVERYAGSYRNTRRSYTQLEKIISLILVTDVSTTNDGYLMTSNPDETIRWEEVGPHLFREVGGERFIAFREGEGGPITHLLSSVDSSERIGFFEGALWLFLMLEIGVVTAIGMTRGAWIRRKQSIAQTGLERRSAQLMGILGVLWLLFFASLGIAIVEVAADLNRVVFFEYPTPAIQMTLVFLLFSATLTVLGLASLIPVWRSRSWPLGRRLRHSVAVLVLTVLVWTLDSWNLVGFKYF
jgi:CubicO group peptidase (beta-lactamase class C family)